MRIGDAKTWLRDELSDWVIAYVEKAAADPMKFPMDQDSGAWLNSFFEWLKLRHQDLDRDMGADNDLEFEDDEDA